MRQSTNTQRLSRISIQRMIDEEKLRAGALLYEQYYTAMLKRARRYLSDIFDAEDVVSNCWIRLLPRIHTLADMDEPARSSYLLTTVQNESIDHLRRQQRYLGHTVELDENMADAGAGDQYDDLMVCDALSSMLTMLPPQEARIVRLKLNGISNEEISSLLHISQSTVRVYWLRGRARLRLLIQTLDK